MTNAQFSFAGLARRYAEAWTSRNPEAVAGFYAPDGKIVINEGEPHVGRQAIAAMAAGFYAEFPDLVVHCDLPRLAGHHGVFIWTLEGHHAETGNYVRVGGWEEWDLDAEMNVTQSRGWFDGEEYARQIDGRAS
jgi:uncharacterized protein (TIGR02246 family)